MRKCDGNEYVYLLGTQSKQRSKSFIGNKEGNLWATTGNEHDLSTNRQNELLYEQQEGNTKRL